MMSANSQSKSTGSPSAEDSNARIACEKLADQGRLLDLLNYLEDHAGRGVLYGSLPLVSRCIRVRAAADLTLLTEDLFARIIGLAGVLLVKAQLAVTQRLMECERGGAHALSRLPEDLTHGGWIDRCENLARFIAEMTVTRSRVRHVNELNERSTGQHRNRRRARSPVAADPSPAPGGAGPARNGRIASPAPRLSVL